MKTRIITAAVGLPVLLVLLLAAPLWAFGTAVGVICTIAAYELMHMALGPGPKRMYISTMLCALAMPVAFSLGVEFSWGVGMLLFLFFLLSIEQMVSYSGRWRITLSMIAIAMLAGGVLPMMLSTLLRIGLIEKVGRVRMLLPFVIAFGSDTGAYFVGMFWGKQKLAPHISPKKTLEGAIGGVVAGGLCALIYGIVLILCGFGVNLVSLTLFGLIGSVIAQLGDLTFSAFKRQYDIKDYGKLLPGHGGALDRFDSLYYLAPLTEVWIAMAPAIWAKG
ncbi:MAG: phosphatidate cytidylyltransferase [Oscillospiraceae bacterium]|nr:phosphatidate cytidylyltransferase [Oscillospiraceae bacterium]